MLTAKIVKKDGFGVRNSVYFEAEDFNEITPERAMEVQTKLGYMPQGYGFEGFKVEKDPVLMRFKATWRCQASCD